MACRCAQILEFVTESYRFRRRVQRGERERWDVDSAARRTVEAVHKVGTTLCVAPARATPRPDHDLLRRAAENRARP